MAAPTATTSSGLTVMFGSLPPVSRRTRACTAGIRVEPPTRMTSSMSSAVTFASAMACSTGPSAALDQVGGELLERRAHQRRRRGASGPLASAVTNGRLTCGLGDRRQLDLGLLGRLEQALQRLRVVAQVDAVARSGTRRPGGRRGAGRSRRRRGACRRPSTAPRPRRRRRRGCSRRTCRRRGRRPARSRASCLSSP